MLILTGLCVKLASWRKWRSHIFLTIMLKSAGPAMEICRRSYVSSSLFKSIEVVRKVYSILDNIQICTYIWKLDWASFWDVAAYFATERGKQQSSRVRSLIHTVGIKSLHTPVKIFYCFFCDEKDKSGGNYNV